MNKFGILVFGLITFNLTAQPLQLNDKEKLINLIQNKITNEYVLTENIEKINHALTQLKQNDKINKVTTKSQLAKLIGTTIKQFDGHFSIIWRDPNTLSTTPKKHEGWFNKLSRKNSGFNKVEILDGNIGYVDFWGFDNVNAKSRKKAEAVMTFLEDTDAMIFDLRNNGGGSAVMIQLISSYFFNKSVHLNSFYSRRTGQTNDFWSYSNVNGKKRPNVPIYILTSDYTFSAAEEFSYNFKHLQRATIVGEATGGGANPVTLFDLGDGYQASIPISKAVNPITKTNWEGVGVQPDIAIASELALDRAYKLALEKVKSKTTNTFQLKEIEQQLNTLSTL